MEFSLGAVLEGESVEARDPTDTTRDEVSYESKKSRNLAVAPLL